MKIRGLLEEDFVNYQKCSMLIYFPYCDWKCGKELCQNSPLALSKIIEISPERLLEKFRANPISKAIVCGGLEPLESFRELLALIRTFREHGIQDPFIIYTGFRKPEVLEHIEELSQYPNIIMKFGRFRPNEEPHFDEVLGVNLANKEQYAEVIS